MRRLWRIVVREDSRSAEGKNLPVAPEHEFLAAATALLGGWGVASQSSDWIPASNWRAITIR